MVLCRHMGHKQWHSQLVHRLLVMADSPVPYSEELCASAATMANNLDAAAIFVYTRRGYMANFLSRCRPDCPIFAFTGALIRAPPWDYRLSALNPKSSHVPSLVVSTLKGRARPHLQLALTSSAVGCR